MPIAPNISVSKVICNSCGWHIIVHKHSGGGVVSSFDVPSMVGSALLNNVPSCGRCGGKDLKICDATLLDYVNPIEYVRKIGYTCKRALSIIGDIRKKTKGEK
jgi:hypothetical protein